MILKKMKSLIKYAIDLDIDYLETFLGYEGDSVIKIFSKKEDVIDLVKAYARKEHLDFRTDYELFGRHKDSYVIYIGVKDSNVYALKRD